MWGSPDRGDVLADLFARTERFSMTAVAAGCSAATVLIAVVDASVTPLLALSVFYLLPVLVAASRSLRLGAFSALFTSTAWCAVDLLRHGSVYGSPLVPVANAVSRLLVLTVVALLVTALREDRQREADMARVDQLTGLANARSFHDALELARQGQSRTGLPVTVAYLDVDDFKSVNDSLGHAAGDQVLRRTGTVLAESVRAVDTVARLGGDEFGVLMPATTAEDAATALARVHERLTQSPSASGGDPGAVQVSIGAVTFTGPLAADAMISAADGLMYEAKRGGKNQLVLSTR